MDSSSSETTCSTLLVKVRPKNGLRFGDAMERSSQELGDRWEEDSVAGEALLERENSEPGSLSSKAPSDSIVIVCKE